MAEERMSYYIGKSWQRKAYEENSSVAGEGEEAKKK